MTPEALAALHAAAFDHQPPPWSASAFAGLIADPAVFLTWEACGFALGRRAGTEAELLTLAVAPEARRRGLGRRLVLAFEAASEAEEAFLEVAETNFAARALYDRLGYRQVGRRRGYYRGGAGLAVDALVLRKPLAGIAETI